MSAAVVERPAPPSAPAARQSAAAFALAALQNVSMCAPTELGAILIEVGRVAVDIMEGRVAYENIEEVVELIDQACSAINRVKEIDLTCGACSGTGEGCADGTLCTSCHGACEVRR